MHLLDSNDIYFPYLLRVGFAIVRYMHVCTRSCTVQYIHTVLCEYKLGSSGKYGLFVCLLRS